MRPTLLFPAGLVVGIALSGGLCAQSAGAESSKPATAVEQEKALAEKAAKAIADFEAIKNNRKLTRRAGRQLTWLAEIEHDSIIEYLEQQLEASAPGNGAVRYLQAIAVKPRPQLQKRVWSVLHHPKASATVRRAAAITVLSMGTRSAGRLLKMLRSGSEAAKEPVRLATAQAIVASKDERLIRGLTPLFEQGTSADKLKFLRLLEPVQGVTAISAVRARLVTRGTLILGAIAWRQLALEGDSRAGDLAIDLLERMPEGPPPNVAAEMITGLVMVRDADLYPLLLRYGANPNKAIKQALRAAAPHAAKDMALMRYLARYGIEADRPGARDAAIMLLRQAPKEAITPLVDRVRRELRRPRKAALDLATGLHELLAKDPSWRKDLLKLAASSEPAVRTVGLSLLRELECADAIGYAQKSLGSRQWELRAASIRYLTSFREVSSIPLLIARFDKEEGRLRSELGNALFVHTGTRCWKKAEWRAWWSKNKAGFMLPHPDSVRSGLGGIAGQTSAYFGIPLVSKRAAFLIDVSGSMAARIGTNKNRRRIDGAKQELTKALTEIPEDHFINLIIYSSGVRAVWEELRRARDDNRKEIIDRAKKLRVGGGTNIYGALELAFQDPTVDTIYLLTDGQPSGGEVTVPDEIADEVRRWNRLRQIVIHTIGFGIDSPLLKRLADESGGAYRYVQ